MSRKMMVVLFVVIIALALAGVIVTQPNESRSTSHIQFGGNDLGVEFSKHPTQGWCVDVNYRGTSTSVVGDRYSQEGCE